MRIKLPIPAAPTSSTADPQAVVCRTCGAAVGQPCRSLAAPLGHLTVPLAMEHRARIEAVR